MPNWVTNIIHMRGEQEAIDRVLDAIRNKETGEPMDFCRLIPMPEELMVECGTTTEFALSAYLSAVNENNPHNDEWKYPKMPESLFGATVSALESVCACGMRISDFRTDLSPSDSEYGKVAKELVELGKQYADNYYHYGHLTWYDYCVDKWGTKWNAQYQHQCDTGTGAWEISFDTAWSPPIPIFDELVFRFPEVQFEIHWADEDLGSNTGYAEGVDGVLKTVWYTDLTRAAYEHACSLFGTTPEEEGIKIKD